MRRIENKPSSSRLSSGYSPLTEGRNARLSGTKTYYIHTPEGQKENSRRARREMSEGQRGVTRRQFLSLTALTAASLTIPHSSPANISVSKTLTIIHTNDLHSGATSTDRIKQVAAKIKAVKKEASDTIVVDAGDMTHPIFYMTNYVSPSDLIAYDAVNFNHTQLDYKIINKGRIRVGIIMAGAGNDDEKINRLAYKLRFEKHCHLAVLLSHSGLEKDKKMAAESSGIDLIIGGHSHTVLHRPITINNKQNKIVNIAQTGWGGQYLGRIHIQLSANSRPLIKGELIEV